MALPVEFRSRLGHLHYVRIIHGILGSTMPFDPTNFVNNQQPAITAAQLNKLGSQYDQVVADIADGVIPAGLSEEAIAEDITDPSTAIGTALTTTTLTARNVPKALRLALLNRATQPINMCMYGSSSTQGLNASPKAEKYVNKVARMLQSSFNPEGIAGGIWYPSAEEDWAFVGATAVEMVGPSGKAQQLASGATASLSVPLTDGFTIPYAEGPGASGFTVAVDGVDVATITPSTSGEFRWTGKWTSNVVTRGEHVIRVTANGPSFQFAGVFAHDGDQTIGIRGWGFGKGSTTIASWNGTTATVTAVRSAMKAIAPTIVAMMTGNNERSDALAPATFETRMNIWIEQTRTDLGYTPCFLLLGMITRADSGPESGYSPYTQQQYLDVLAKIAAERSEYVVYVPPSDLFSDSMSNDINGLRSDPLHPTTKGHAALADAIGSGLRLPSLVSAARKPFTAGSGGDGSPAVTLTRIVSDSFTGADTTNINARAADLAAGGVAQSWTVGTANALGIQSNHLYRPSGTGFGYFITAGSNVQAGLKILDTATKINIIVRRTGTASTALRYQATVSLGTVQLSRGNATQTPIGAVHAHGAGDVVAIRALGSKISLLINGVVVETVTDSTIPDGTYQGLATISATDTAAAVNAKDFTLDSVALVA